MSKQNPFVAALSNFGVDPKAAAEGQYITANTSVKSNEATILADRIAARKRLLAAGGFAPGVLDAGLANDIIDPQKLQTAQGVHLGRNNIVDATGKVLPGLKPEQLGVSSLLMGHGIDVASGTMMGGKFPSGPKDPTTYKPLQFIKGTNGEPDMVFDPVTGQTRLATIEDRNQAPAAPAAPLAANSAGVPAAGKPVAAAAGKPVVAAAGKPPAPVAAGRAASPIGKQYQKITPSTTPGVPSQIVTYELGPNGEQKIIKVENVDTRAGQGLSQATLAQLKSDRLTSDKTQYAKAIASGDPFEWLLNKHLGLLDGEGNRTDPSAELNTLEMNSFKELARKYHNAGYNITESLNAAMEAHPQLKSGRGNMEDKEWGNEHILMDVEKDASGRALQNLGRGDKKLMTSKGFRQTIKKKLGDDGKPLPSGKVDDPTTKNYDESVEYEVDTSKTDYSNNETYDYIPVPLEISAMGGGKGSVSNLFATKSAKPQVAELMEKEADLTDGQVGKWVYQLGKDGNPTFGIVIKDPKTKKPKFSPVTGELPE